MFPFIVLWHFLKLRFGPNRLPDSQVRDDEDESVLDAPNWGVLTAIRDRGDQPEIVRTIDHYLYHPEGAPGDLNGMFAAVDAKDGWTPHVIEGGVHIEVQSPALAHHVAEQIEWATATGLRFGYEYDGWETSIERGEA